MLNFWGCEHGGRNGCKEQAVEDPELRVNW